MLSYGIIEPAAGDGSQFIEQFLQVSLISIAAKQLIAHEAFH